MFANVDKVKKTNLVEVKVETKSSELSTDTSQENVAGTEKKQSTTVGTLDVALPTLQKSATETEFCKNGQKAKLDNPTIQSAQSIQANVTAIKPPGADQSKSVPFTPAKRIPISHMTKQISDIKPLPPSRTTAAIRAAASSRIDTGPRRSKSKLSRNLSIRGGLEQRTASITSLSSTMNPGPNLGSLQSTSPDNLATKLPNSLLSSVSKVGSISSLATSKTSDEKPNNVLRRRVLEKNQLTVFETCHSKMREMQSDFMKKCENIKGISGNLQRRYKFVAMILNDQSKLMINDDDLLRLPQKLPTVSVNDLKERVRFTIETGLNILYDHLCNTQLCNDQYECRVKVAATRQKIEDLQDKKIDELFKQIDMLCKTSDGGGDAVMTRALKDLQEARRNLQTAERKLLDMKKQHAEELAALDRNHKAVLAEEMKKHEAAIKESTKHTQNLTKNFEDQKMLWNENEAMIASIRAECKTHETNIEELKAIIQKLTNQLKENEVLLSKERESTKHYVSQIDSLRGELKHARGLLEILQSQPLSDERLASKEVVISDLTKQVAALEKYKETLETQVDGLVMHCETIDMLHKKLENSESKVVELQAKLERLPLIQPSKLDNADEYESLKQRLSKAQDRITRLEDQAGRDHQMLHVRADMITTLQTHEKESRRKLEDLAFELGEKNSLIDQVNTELLTKTEEFRNLFNTLGAKQMEMTRQSHIIKLLEENNERNQTLRVKQEERIAQQDDEIAHLKHTMDVYRRIMISNGGRNLFEPFPPATLSSDSNVQHEPTCKLYKLENTNNEHQ